MSFDYNLQNALLWGNCENNFKKASMSEEYANADFSIGQRIGFGLLGVAEAIPLVGQVISLIETGYVNYPSLAGRAKYEELDIDTDNINNTAKPILQPEPKRKEELETITTEVPTADNANSKNLVSFSITVSDLTLSKPPKPSIITIEINEDATTEEVLNSLATALELNPNQSIALSGNQYLEGEFITQDNASEIDEKIEHLRYPNIKDFLEDAEATVVIKRA